MLRIVYNALRRITLLVLPGQLRELVDSAQQLVQVTAAVERIAKGVEEGIVPLENVASLRELLDQNLANVLYTLT